MQTPTDTESNIIVKLERQSAFISEWSSGGSANKTTARSSDAPPTCRAYVGFSRRKIPPRQGCKVP